MDKLFLVVMVLLLAFPCFSYAADENSTRSMAAEQLFQYGQAVYDRGDLSQAAQIFSRVLVMVPEHAGAMQYAKILNKKGQSVTMPTRTLSVELASPQKFVEKSASLKANEDLKQNIQEVDQAIVTIQKDVAELRMQMAQERNDLEHPNESPSSN